MDRDEFKRKMKELGYSDSEIEENENSREEAKEKGVIIPYTLYLIPKEPIVAD